MAVQVYNDIIKHGKVTRGGIGVSIALSEAPGTAALLKANGASEGAFVQAVNPGGPADKAGIKDGDIIVSIDGKAIRDGNQLINQVSSTSVGTALNVTILRGGKRENIKVVVGDLAQIFPDRFGSGSDNEPEKAEGAAASFGMSIQNLTDRQRETMNLKDRSGVEVVQVEPNSFAEDIGLARGDILTEINRKPVTSVDDVAKIKATLKPGDAVAFRVLRRAGGRTGDWTSNFLAGILPNNAQ
jgi:serine protease Do